MYNDVLQLKNNRNMTKRILKASIYAMFTVFFFVSVVIKMKLSLLRTIPVIGTEYMKGKTCQ